MPKVNYTASKGLIQETGSGIVLEKTNGTCSGDAATIGGTTGVITLAADAIAAGAVGDQQTITNGNVTTASVVLLKTHSDSDGTGIPVPMMTNITNGTFTFLLQNAHVSGAINAGNVKVSYVIL